MPEGWRCGLGVALDRFLGRRFDAPHAIGLPSGKPTSLKRSQHDSGLLPFTPGDRAQEARLLSVVSGACRGAGTGGPCSQNCWSATIRPQAWRVMPAATATPAAGC